MMIFDRYVAKLFIRVTLVCFLGMTGLYCVFDALNNLDELAALGKQLGGVPNVLLDYYGARVPWFFDRISALVALVGAIFAVTWLQRTNELTAMMAAGISKARIIKPIIIAVCLIAILAAANRELVLPRVRDQLVRNAQNWLGQKAQPVQATTDIRTEILLGGKSVIPGERRIEEPNFLMYESYGSFGRRLQAANAYHLHATSNHPNGYLLDQVTQPEDPMSLASIVIEGRPIILTPQDQKWLKPNQIFVASEVGFQQLARGKEWQRYSSTPELIAQLHNPSLDYGLDARVAVHSRIVQPFLDMTLLFLGLPLVLTRENRNIFVAVGWCFLIVLVFMFVIVACQAMGGSGYLLTPPLAAWLPLLVFVPVAAAASYSIWHK